MRSTPSSKVPVTNQGLILPGVHPGEQMALLGFLTGTALDRPPPAWMVDFGVVAQVEFPSYNLPADIRWPLLRPHAASAEWQPVSCEGWPVLR